MPGHKGRGPLGIEQRDITEIAGADILSESEGILGESQKNSCALFGTGATLYSTEGSSLAIKAMLYAVVMSRGTGISGNSGQRPFILAARNVHRAMLDGCALLDLDVEFISSKNSRGICSRVISRLSHRYVMKKGSSSQWIMRMVHIWLFCGKTDIRYIWERTFVVTLHIRRFRFSRGELISI